MATLSLRMRDDLKAKAQPLAHEQGVWLDGFINATLAATIAQQETLALFSDRLRDVDRDALHHRVLGFMSKSRPGTQPTHAEIDRAIRGKRGKGS